MNNGLRGAAFLDRDGVINEEVDYLYEPDKAVLIPQAAQALRELRERGYLAVVVTNQSGIARGMYTAEDMEAVHRRLQEMLAEEGAMIDAFYYCPHHPEFTGSCDCRKPMPGMLLKAAKDFGIDFRRSMMAGDRTSDLEAGKAAGCASNYLVRTGYGEKTLAKGVPSGFTVVPDLLAAVRDFLEKQRSL